MQFMGFKVDGRKIGKGGRVKAGISRAQGVKLTAESQYSRQEKDARGETGFKPIFRKGTVAGVRRWVWQLLEKNTLLPPL